MDFRAKNRKVRQGESGFSERNEAFLRRKDARFPTGVVFSNTPWAVFTRLTPPKTETRIDSPSSHCFHVRTPMKPAKLLLPLLSLCLLLALPACKPSLSSKNPTERAKAVATQKLDDATALKIALEDPDLKVRAAAVQAISSEETLEKVALNSPAVELRVLASRRIENPGRALAIVRGTKDPYVAASLMEKIVDGAALRQIALSSPVSEIRILATQKIEDVAVLAELAADNDDPSAALEALLRVHDEKRLAEIARKNKNQTIRTAAIVDINDVALLRSLHDEIAAEDELVGMMIEERAKMLETPPEKSE